MSASGSLEIREWTDRGAVAALEAEWKALVDRCSSATIYQTWEWNSAWWRAYGDRKRPRLICAYAGMRLVGLAPLYVSGHFRTPLRRLAFIGTGQSDYLDILAEDVRAEEASRAILRYLDHMAGYDMASLQQLRQNALTLSAQDDIPEERRHRRWKLRNQEPCPFLPLPASWDEFTRSLGKKTRTNLAYHERLLKRDFPGVEMALAEPEELDEALEALFALHQRRWHARLLPGVMGSGRVRRFHREAAAAFAGRGWLRLHLLRENRRIIAALYCFAYRRRYYYYLGGFEPELAKYSPGTTLTGRAIRQAIEEGCEEFDFLRGAEPYKYRWRPQERFNQELLLAGRSGARSRALLALNRLERRIEHHAKAIAENRGRRRRT